MKFKAHLLSPQLVIALLLMLFSLPMFAQKRITGTITGADGGIPASVVIKGTTTGTVADIDGNFALDNVANTATIVISAVGYQSQDILVGEQTTFTIKMVEASGLLSEVVVSGYFTENKRQTTAAVSTVKARDLTAVPSGNVEQQLQGRVSGLTVITNGQPGTNSIIRVRGFGSFGGNEPLYIVDGVPVSSTDFLAPDDIENTTVLKDAAAASIYGSRAAGGVIVYTTKRGKAKEKGLSISYDGLYGVTTPGTGISKLNPQETADWTWTAIKNAATAAGTAPVFNHPQYGSGTSPVLPDYLLVGSLSGAAIPAGSVNLTTESAKYNNDAAKGGVYLVVPSNKAGTDWYGAITRSAPMTRHNLGITGASDNARYYVGLGLQNQDGILKNNTFKRYHLRANSEFDISKNVRIGQNLQITYRQVLGQGGNNNGAGIAESESDILAAFRMPTIIPIYDAFGGYAGTQAKGFNNPRNPVAIRDRMADNTGFNMAGFGNVYAEADLLPGLSVRTSIGGQYSNWYGVYYNKPSYENSENFASFTYGEYSGTRLNWTNTNTVRYNKTFGIHTIDAMVGIEALNTGKGRDISGTGQEPFAKDVNFINLNTATTSRQVVSNLDLGSTFYSKFGRINYSLQDKYYFTALIRQDASSRFGANSRVGVFPAVSAAWRVTGEDFLKNSKLISDLKVRVGWGQMGNSNNVPPTNQYTLYSGDLGGGSYPISGSNTSAAAGFFQSTIGNPDARWETSETMNFGFDAGLWNNKVELVVDLWRKNTKDLLFQKPLPVVGGLAAPPFINIAKMVNQGLDIQLTNRGKIAGDWKYEVSAIGSFLHNEIVELAENVPYFEVNPPTNRLGGAPVRNMLGQSISAFWGYKVAGLFQTKAEADASGQPDAAAGRLKFTDMNGDGKITPADRTTIGSPVPKFTGGLTLTATYKDFGLSTYIYGSYGNKIYNMSKWYTDFYPSFTGSALSARVKDSWSPSNTGSSIPIFEGASNFSTNTQSNSYYVEDGSYLRMQNVTLSYNVPAKFMGNAFKRMKVSVAANNLFTLTKYQGLDPAVGGAADSLFGIDLGNYPVTRSYMFAINVGL
jgi:TonB-dependent starch-binding outer membrane protein SusC